MLFRAARYLGIPADRLARMPRSWRDAAIAAETAEVEARDEIRKRAEKKAGAGARKARRRGRRR